MVCRQLEGFWRDAEARLGAASTGSVGSCDDVERAEWFWTCVEDVEMQQVEWIKGLLIFFLFFFLLDNLAFSVTSLDVGGHG